MPPITASPDIPLTDPSRQTNVDPRQWSIPPFLPLQGVLVANAENDNMQLAANATTINVRKRNADSSLGMLAAANFDQRLYSATRKRRVTGSRVVGRIDIGFVFDTHAIIYSEDAPGLERALHAEFEPVRVNAQNYRKEFFKAKLDEVEDAVMRLAPDAPFFKDVEAQDYRETLAKRRSALLAQEMATETLLPEAI